MESAYPKRLIEVDLPIKRISAHARREKSIRHGHISTLHIWWARRPLAACRAVICAALWPDPAGEEPPCPQSFRKAAARIITEFARKAVPSVELRNTCSPESFARWETLAKEKNLVNAKDPAHQNILRFALLDFIADFANWDNSTVPAYLETARALTQAAHESLGGEPGTRPLVVDPFAGGGSIPLEALRVGADAFASDLNPVAVLLNKVVLEYIPKYGQKLADDVRKWGQWIKEQAEKELAPYYPNDPDGTTPITYLWARTILSEAPDQGKVPVEIPLIRSMWLAKRKGSNRALRWVRNDKGQIKTVVVEKKFADGVTRKVRQPQFEICEPRNETEVEKGTSAGGKATCPITNYTTPVESVRRQLITRRGGAADARLLLAVSTSDSQAGRIYLQPTKTQVHAARAAAVLLEQSVLEASADAIPLLPAGKLNHLRGFFNVVLYGMTTWGDLFSPRQALVLSKIAAIVNRIGESGRWSDPEMGRAVQSCLALAVDRLADYCSSLCRWVSAGEFIGNTFGRQALPMIWDFVEINPFANMGWKGACEWIRRVIEANAAAQLHSGTVTMSAAAAAPLPDASVDAAVTDPPYYAAIPYADCSDFFYSWLKRSLSNVEPVLLSGDLTPKEEECVQLSHRAAMYRQKDGAWFERKMQDACERLSRVTKASGIGVFVFANKETAGWEAMLAALISSGWVISASWPIDTEMGARLRAKNSAVLASSVHLVCRPRSSNTVGDWRDVLAGLPTRMHDWMPRLASEGVVGADAIFACLGPALENFSRFAKVEKANGERVELNEYLEHVWAAVAKEALLLIFVGADATGFDPDARLTAMWFWTLSTGATKNGTSLEEESAEESDEESPGIIASGSGFVLEYDAARKIAQGLGASLEQLSQVVEVKGDKATLLSVSGRARFLFGKDEGKAPAKRGRKKIQQGSLFDDPSGDDTQEGVWGELNAAQVGHTVLDRLHQSMILFGAGRTDTLKRFLVEEGVGRDARFWRLAQALSALYPTGTEEKRWVDGVLARKKGLGF